jgi:hypothetical protein
VVPDPEPRDLVAFEKTESPEVESHTRGVDRLPVAHPLETKTRVRRILAEKAIRLTGLLLHVCGQTTVSCPEPPAFRVTSQFLRVEFGRLPASSIVSRFASKFPKRILRPGELASPAFLVTQFLKQPLSDPILLIGRKVSELCDSGIESTSHQTSIDHASGRGLTARCS